MKLMIDCQGLLGAGGAGLTALVVKGLAVGQKAP
jgi:hypothetical protein